MRRVLLLLLFSLSLCACGKKGQLVPPESFAPAAIGNLKAAQKGSSFELTWSAPGKEEGGAPLAAKEITGFILLRHIVLPPGEDCDECLNAYSELRRVDLDFLRDVRRVGSLFVTDDPYIKPGETYQYKTVVLKRDGSRSKDSNKARRKAVSPPPAPSVRLTASATALDLEIAVSPPDNGRLLGYNIYRWKKGQPEPLSPVNAAPLTEKTFHDELLQPAVTYLYKVRSVAVIDGETVESSASNLLEGMLSEPD